MNLLAALLLAAELLTNADVVKLVKTGLSAETIEAKIAASPASFDTSTDALVALANAGVPDRVVRAMINTAPVPVPAPAPAPVHTRSKGLQRFEVAIHSSEHARCTGGELRIDSMGVSGSGCRKELDFKQSWSAIRGVEYEYGVRSTIVFRTLAGEHRVSTDTPVQAEAIVEHIRASAPQLSVNKK